LVAIGILAGGLHGISEKLKLGPALMPDDDIATSGQYLAATLQEAVDAFEASPIARDYLGAEFVASFAATRRGELAAFDKWWRGNITDWELKRYMEHI
jgi:glutamine synthetase